MALLIETAWYVNNGNGSTTGYWAVTPWAANTAVTVGTLRRQVSPAVGNERVFVCVVAGTTHASIEPTWPTFIAGAVVDNTVKWIEVTGVPSMNGDVVNTQGRPTVFTSLSVGVIIKRANGASYQVVTTAQLAGGGSEPAFSDTAGVTTTDSGVVWTSLGPVGNFPAWGAPAARINTVTNFGTSRAANFSTIYVAHDHYETASVATSITQFGQSTPDMYSILCVNRLGSMPPVYADLRTTAVIETTGASNLQISWGVVHCYGLIFSAGTGAVSNLLEMRSLRGAVMERCSFRKLGSVGANPAIHLGTAKFIGCTFQYGSTSDSTIADSGQVMEIIGDAVPNPIIGSIVPSTWLYNYTNAGQKWLLSDLDLTSFGAGTFLVSMQGSGNNNAVLRNCKINPAVSVNNPSTGPGGIFSTATVMKTDSSANVVRTERYGLLGTQSTDLAIVRTGGAIDTATPIAWKVVANSAARTNLPFPVLPLASYNTLTATNVTATVQGLLNGTALPTNIEVRMEVDYLGTSGSTLGTTKSTGSMIPLFVPSNHSASTEAWDSLATARANSTAYTVGQVVKVSSNAGRVFFCITAGTSAASLPVGFAGAVDGGSVTDGGAVFRAAVRFEVALVLTAPQPAYAQLLTANLFIGKASTTYYIDPKLTLT